MAVCLAERVDPVSFLQELRAGIAIVGEEPRRNDLDSCFAHRGHTLKETRQNRSKRYLMADNFRHVESLDLLSLALYRLTPIIYLCEEKRPC